MATDRIDEDRGRREVIRDDDRRTSLPQNLARLIGLVFLLIGVLGFIPGVTHNFDELNFAGHESDAELFGIFQVSVLLNVIHIALGIAGLVLSGSAAGARSFLIGGGLVSLAMWLIGLLTTQRSDGNFLPVNVEDDYLHLILGAVMLLLALAPRGRAEPARVPDGERAGTRRVR